MKKESSYKSYSFEGEQSSAEEQRELFQVSYVSSWRYVRKILHGVVQSDDDTGDHQDVSDGGNRGKVFQVSHHAAKKDRNKYRRHVYMNITLVSVIVQYLQQYLYMSEEKT